MAITIIATYAKKIPVAGLEYSSAQASCSIQSDIIDLTQVESTMRALYALAERTVDAQLQLTPAARSLPQTALSVSQAPNHAGAPGHQLPIRAGGRRSPGPLSPAQRRYLSQLLDANPSALPQILTEHHVSTIDELTSRDASRIIDRLKGVTA